MYGISQYFSLFTIPNIFDQEKEKDCLNFLGVLKIKILAPCKNI